MELLTPILQFKFLLPSLSTGRPVVLSRGTPSNAVCKVKQGNSAHKTFVKSNALKRGFYHHFSASLLYF